MASPKSRTGIRRGAGRTAAAPEMSLQTALAEARKRGQLRAAEILGGDDMMSADAFAKVLGTPPVTVNTKRQSGQVLGLSGAKRGFRFPVWQLNMEGRPYPELPVLHQRLGGPWGLSLPRATAR